MHVPRSSSQRRSRSAACAPALFLALLAACVAAREDSGRGWAPPVLPAQATLRPEAGAEGGVVVLLVETERGVLLRVLGAHLAPGAHELVLAPDAERGYPLERLGLLRIGADGRSELELELPGATLAGGSRLIERELVLIGPTHTLLRGRIEKGIDVEGGEDAPATLQPRAPLPRAERPPSAAQPPN